LQARVVARLYRHSLPPHRSLRLAPAGTVSNINIDEAGLGEASAQVDPSIGVPVVELCGGRPAVREISMYKR
jgi:hypothetical protein